MSAIDARWWAAGLALAALVGLLAVAGPTASAQPDDPTSVGCAGVEEDQHCRGLAVSGTGDARCESVVYVPCISASLAGDAACKGFFCSSASVTGNASGDIAVSVTGNGSGDFAVSGIGSADGWHYDVSACDTARGLALDRVCHPREGDGVPEPCTPHPAIRITEPEGPEGFVLEEEAPAPVYRPGSGVVAGKGTAEDPYVIEGWCLAGVHIEDTEAHVVVRDNTVDDPAPPEQYEGVSLRDAANVTIENNRLAGEDGGYEDSFDLWGVENVEVRDNTIRDLERAEVGYSDEVTIQGNDLRHQRPGFPVLSVRGSTDVEIEANRIPSVLLGEDYCWEDDCLGVGAAELRDNDIGSLAILHSTGLLLRDNRLDRGIFLWGEATENYIHDIDASNTVDGEPVRNLVGVDGVTVTEPVGQVIVGASSNVTVHDVDLDHAPLYAVDSADVTVEETVSNGTSAAISARQTNGLEVRNTTIEHAWTGLLALASDDVGVVDTNVTVDDHGVLIGGGEGHRLAGNNFGFHEKDRYDAGVYADANETVDARDNWWGCPDGPDHPECADVEGDVIVDPWLTEPNPEAGAD